jgi:hypothetical protein
MSEPSAPEPIATVTLPETGIVDGRTVHAGESLFGSGPQRGPGGKFLPRAGGETKVGAEESTVLPAAPRPAKSKARPIRLKQAKPARQPERVAAARAKREILQQAEQTANAITRMLVSAVVIGVGEEARPSPDLEKEIKDPMGRILERLEPETSEALATYADPLMLVTAFIAWGVQISRVMAVRRETEEAAEAEKTTPGKRTSPASLPVDAAPDRGSERIGDPPGESYIPTGETVPPDQISRLMGEPSG